MRTKANLQLLMAASPLRKLLLEAAMSVLAPKPIHRADANPSFERLLDSEEAASLLKIHPKTLQKMARSGEIAGVQIGKLWRFRASVLNDWLRERMAS